MNLFIFNGTICRDIELKYTQNSGLSVISNSLAFNKKDANGNQSAVFLDFGAFGKTAELINQYYQKGDMLCGQGEISQDEWQDLSHICNFHHSSRQCRILNPLSKARDRTRNLTVPSWIR